MIPVRCKGASVNNLLNLAQQKRLLSVAGWGLNTSGQVGEGLADLHAEPCILNHLEGEGVTHIAAGKNHSAAAGGGASWTWGCGQAGKLGHGDDKAKIRPQRMEALIGRADIVQAALGSNHSIFLDSFGFPFSCGDNEKGQCREELGVYFADQAKDPDSGNGLAIPDVLAVSSGLENATHHQSFLLQERLQERSQMFAGSIRLPFPQLDARQFEVDQLRSMLEESGQDMDWQAAAYQAINPARFEALPAALPLPDASKGFPTTVQSIAASTSFSALITAEGKVVFIGQGIFPQQGGSSPKLGLRFLADVQKQVDMLGGALRVEAAETFCVILTKIGQVVLAGRLPPLPGWTESDPTVLVLKDLPPISHIAAGGRHVLLSDGSNVWTVGMWKTGTGNMMHDSWVAPRLITTVSGVHQIAAGQHASAVVDDNYQLHMWGRLVSKAEAVKHRQGSWKPKHGSFFWEGLGRDAPCQVSGLGKVEAVALGSKHALALVHV